MTQTLKHLLHDASKRLQNAGIEDAGREARLLAEHALRRTAASLMAMSDDPLTEAEKELFDNYVMQRASRQPMSHVIGEKEFYKHRFLITPDVLDPRSDTETLVSAALGQPFETILDLGTGSGCIILSLLDEAISASGIGTDISAKALDIAFANCKNLNLDERCLFVRSEWYEMVDGKFDLIVSNPPYLAQNEMDHVSHELSFEPRIALTDEADGLSAYRTIVPNAPKYLRAGGRLLVEIGWQQAVAVKEIFVESGFEQVVVIHDIEGRDRVISGTLSA